MPRKTRTAGCASPATSTGFNEAAARCRGKQPVAELADDDVARASMRPRPDAAENLEAWSEDEARQRLQ